MLQKSINVFPTQAASHSPAKHNGIQRLEWLMVACWIRQNMGTSFFRPYCDHAVVRRLEALCDDRLFWHPWRWLENYSKRNVSIWHESIFKPGYEQSLNQQEWARHLAMQESGVYRRRNANWEQPRQFHELDGNLCAKRTRILVWSTSFCSRIQQSRVALYPSIILQLRRQYCILPVSVQV